MLAELGTWFHIHYSGMYLYVVSSVLFFDFFTAGLRAVKIITKFWELKRQPLRRILKRLTGNWLWNFIQIKITHLEPQRHLKVKLKAISCGVLWKTCKCKHTKCKFVCGGIMCLSAIGNAYAVLSNTEKRRQYDQYGEERSNPSRHRHHRDFEADISPEDLFNMFFGGGFPSSK